jgi:hypothetical protein
MSDSNDGRRKLTPFLAHEMLYDYVVGNLDPERRAAIEDFVRSDRESQNLLEAIRRGLRYAERLDELNLTPSELEHISSAESFVSLSKRMSRWSEWPDTLRWSIVAVFISMMTALTVVTVPWNKAARFVPSWNLGQSTDEGKHLKLADLFRSQFDEEEIEESTGGSSDSANADAGATGDSSGDQEFADSGPVASSATPKPIAVSQPTPPSATPVAEPVVAPVVATGPTPQPQPTPPETPATKLATTSGVASRSKPTEGGVVQIKELGAEKAGEVELGWKRGTGRYFHFAIPEANEARLLEVLRAYGPVRISKDVHPRVMPAGQLRFILWIESSGN